MLRLLRINKTHGVTSQGYNRGWRRLTLPYLTTVAGEDQQQTNQPNDLAGG